MASNIVQVSPPRLPYASGVEERFGVNRADWKALVEVVWPTAKDPNSIVMALSYCNARKLDPMKKPVHIVEVWSSQARKMVEGIWPGIGELRTTAFRTGQYAGKDETAFGPTITKDFRDRDDAKTSVSFPEWAQVTVYRIIDATGTRVPFVGPKTYWLEAYASKGKLPAPNAMWAKRPFGQLDKCAEAAALRAAFPEELAGQLTVEEMAGQAIGEEPAPPRPTEEDVIDVEVEELPVIDLHDEFGGVIYQTTSWANWVDEYARHYAKADSKELFREFNESAAADALDKVGNAAAIFAEIRRGEEPQDDVDTVQGGGAVDAEPSEGTGEAEVAESGPAEEEGGSEEDGAQDVAAADHLAGEADGSEDQAPQAPSLAIPLEFVRNKPDLTGWYIKATAVVDTLPASQVDDFRGQNKDALARLQLGRKATFEALNKKLEGLA